MQVQFVTRENRPERLVCEAEVLFDEAGPLFGTKLVGFSLWRSPEGEIYVTFPSRALGSGADRRYFDYLRSIDHTSEAVRNVKDWILVQFRRPRRQQTASDDHGGGSSSQPHGETGS